MLLSLIIPAYNEESRIGQTLERYLNFFSRDTEIWVILNNCQDRTLEVVKKYHQHFPGILKYVDIKEAILKGGAIIEGFKRAQGQLIGFVDADGATAPEEFQKLIDWLNGYDAAIASRWIDGAKVLNRTTLRNILSRLFVFISKILFRLPFKDTQCGAKVFKRRMVEVLLPKLRIRNMVFDVELLFLAQAQNFKIKEVPTLWVDQSSSAMLGSPLGALKTSLLMFLTLLKLRLKYIFKNPKN